MHGVCKNKNSELLKLLLEAKLVDQDMLKIPDFDVRGKQASNIWFLDALCSSPLSCVLKNNWEVLKLFNCNPINIDIIFHLSLVCAIYTYGLGIYTYALGLREQV